MALRVFLKQAVENGKVIHPKRFKLNCEEHKGYTYPLCIECLRVSKPSWDIACQYFNNPVDESTIEFKSNWIQKFEYTPDIIEKLNKVGGILSIDPAVTESKASDFTGLVLTKVLDDMNIYILEAKQIKANADKVIDEVFKLVKTYNIWKVLLETQVAQVLFVDLFRKEMAKRNEFFVIDEIKNSTRETKAARIRGLIPYYANMRVWHRSGLLDLEQQLLEFPKNNHDDIIDALAQQPQYWKSKGVKMQPRDNSPYWSLNWWKKQTRAKHPSAIEELFKDFKRG